MTIFTDAFGLQQTYHPAGGHFDVANSSLEVLAQAGCSLHLVSRSIAISSKTQNKTFNEKVENKKQFTVKTMPFPYY